MLQAQDENGCVSLYILEGWLRQSGYVRNQSMCSTIKHAEHDHLNCILPIIHRTEPASGDTPDATGAAVGR